MNKSSINVPLTSEELLIISEWISTLRDNPSNTWNDGEEELSKKFEEYSISLVKYIS